LAKRPFGPRPLSPFVDGERFIRASPGQVCVHAFDPHDDPAIRPPASRAGGEVHYLPRQVHSYAVPTVRAPVPQLLRPAFQPRHFRPDAHCTPRMPMVRPRAACTSRAHRIDTRHRTALRAAIGRRAQVVTAGGPAVRAPPERPRSRGGSRVHTHDSGRDSPRRGRWRSRSGARRARRRRTGGRSAPTGRATWELTRPSCLPEKGCLPPMPPGLRS
jgi:hypothetical protein